MVRRHTQQGLATYVVLVAGLAVASAFDITQLRIPNELILILMALGLTIAAVARNIRRSLIGAVVAFCLGFTLYLANQVGAGDVKLMSAVGLYTGYVAIIILFCISTSLILLCYIIMYLATGTPAVGIPFAPFIFLAFIIQVSYVHFARGKGRNPANG